MYLVGQAALKAVGKFWQKNGRGPSGYWRYFIVVVAVGDGWWRCFDCWCRLLFAVVNCCSSLVGQSHQFTGLDLDEVTAADVRRFDGEELSIADHVHLGGWTGTHTKDKTHGHTRWGSSLLPDAITPVGSEMMGASPLFNHAFMFLGQGTGQRHTRGVRTENHNSNENYKTGCTLQVKTGRPEKG